MSILALARPDIISLKAYSHASWDPAFERLHANELPWRAETDRSLAGLNRYPEPHPHVLAQRLAVLTAFREQLLPGRGSGESSISWCAASARADNVVICPPTFGMYAVAARIRARGSLFHSPKRGFALDAPVCSPLATRIRRSSSCAVLTIPRACDGPAAIEQLL